MFNETMKTALAGAAGALTYAGKVEAAITSGVAGLQPLIEDRLQSERDFRRLECKAAIGEKVEGFEKAREAAEVAAGALKEAGLRLAGFRRARAESAPALCNAFDGLKAALPEHESTIRDRFGSEWTEAARVFAAVSARRVEIEKLLGVRLDLQEPTVAAVPAGELAADMSIPYDRINELKKRIERIAVMNQTATAVDDNRIYALQGGASLRNYDRDGIYVITESKGFDGIPFLTKAIHASFDAGGMEYAVGFGYARPVESMIEPVVKQALEKVKRIEREERETRAQREQRESLDGFSEQKSRRHDLEKLAERCYVPTTPQEIAAGIKEAAEEREAMGKGFEAEEAYAEKVRERREKQAAELAKTRQPEPVKRTWPEGALQ